MIDAVSQAHILFSHSLCLQPSQKLSAAPSVDYVGNSIRCIARTVRFVALILACELSSAAQRCMLVEWFSMIFALSGVDLLLHV